MLFRRLLGISLVLLGVGCSSDDSSDGGNTSDVGTGGSSSAAPGASTGGSTSATSTNTGGSSATPPANTGGVSATPGSTTGGSTSTSPTNTGGSTATPPAHTGGSSAIPPVNTGGTTSIAPASTGGGTAVPEHTGGTSSPPDSNTGGTVSSAGAGTGGASTGPAESSGGSSSTPNAHTGGASSTSDSSTGGFDSSAGANTGGSSSTPAGPCEHECTDFCLNNGGEVVPGTCSTAGDVCCNVESDEIAVSGGEYYVDPDGGQDTNNGTSPQSAWKTLSKIGSVSAGAVVNLKRGGAWSTSGALNLKNVTVRPYGTGPRPVINGTNIVVPQSLGTIVLKGNAILDAVKVTSDQGFGLYIYGDNNIIRNSEVDGADTGALMGIGIVGNENVVTNCYVHDLTVNTGDTGDVNSSGGAEGIVIFGGSHIDIGHNTVARAHCANETLGGDEGGCTEIIMNPLFFNTYGDTVEDVQLHHNLCVDTVGLFESCQGTGEVGFNPTENPGTIKDITVAYNVVLDSKWMYLAQIVNTIHQNVVFEHNTIIHGPRNDTQWSTDAMSHEYMLGMFFSYDTTYRVGVSDNLTANEILIRNNMFWEPFTSEDVFIGYTSGHNNNLFGPSTISLESRWTLDSTESKVDDLGLVDVFHPTAISPAVDRGSSEGLFNEDFYGNAPCGSTPDIGAVEYCEDSAAQARAEEVARYLELNQ